MSRESAPLSRSAFLILLALADEPRHGLGIVDDLDRRTGGQVKLGPGTLYATLQKLADAELIQETAEPPDPEDDDPRRRYYRITEEGLRALRAEAGHLRALVETAVLKNVLEGA